MPDGVILYDLPSPVVMQIGVPPAGYRYVRIDNDVLLIAAGTRMVVDAILDLGRGR
jgi:Ni/Co efflux regulator RcnB